MTAAARHCLVCGNSLAGRHGLTKTCSDACYLERERQRARKRYWKDPETARAYARQRFAGADRDKLLAYRRKYRAANPRIGSVTEWRKQNPEKYRAWQVSYQPRKRELYEADPERHREYSRSWRQQNIEKAREIDRNGHRKRRIQERAALEFLREAYGADHVDAALAQFEKQKEFQDETGKTT